VRVGPPPPPSLKSLLRPRAALTLSGSLFGRQRRTRGRPTRR